MAAVEFYILFFNEANKCSLRLVTIRTCMDSSVLQSRSLELKRQDDIDCVSRVIWVIFTYERQ